MSALNSYAHSYYPVPKTKRVYMAVHHRTFGENFVIHTYSWDRSPTRCESWQLAVGGAKTASIDRTLRRKSPIALVCMIGPRTACLASAKCMLFLCTKTVTEARSCTCSTASSLVMLDNRFVCGRRIWNLLMLHHLTFLLVFPFHSHSSTHRARRPACQSQPRPPRSLKRHVPEQPDV